MVEEQEQYCWTPQNQHFSLKFNDLNMGKETERIESHLRSLYKQRETSLFLYYYLYDWCSAMLWQRLSEIKIKWQIWRLEKEIDFLTVCQYKGQ